MPQETNRPEGQRRRGRFTLSQLLRFVLLASLAIAPLAAWWREEERQQFPRDFVEAILRRDKQRYQAAVRRDPSLVNMRLERFEASWIGVHGEQVSSRWEDVPVLQVAVNNQDIEAVRFLLENGADVNAVDHYQGAAIHHAARLNDDTIFFLLLEHGADVHAPGWAETALSIARTHGRGRVVEALLVLDAQKDLHSACALGDLPRVKQLLGEDRSELDARGPDGRTPLVCAILGDQLHVVRYLLSQGADVKVPNARRALLNCGNAAAYNEYVDAQLRGNPAFRESWQSPLAVAAGHGRWQIANLLTAQGADVHLSSDAKYTRWTPLHLAARAGQAETARLLLAHGAEANKLSDYNGVSETPLQAALRNEHQEIVDLLRAAGAR